MNHTAQKNDMNDDDVIAYLKNNPQFLQKNPDALDYLIPPKDKSNGRHVVDFNHYMLEKLKADKRMVLDTTRDIIEVSRENMNNLARIHDAVLRFLEAGTFNEFVQVLSVDVPVILDCDAASLIIESEHDFSKAQHNTLKIVSSGTVENWMEGHTARLYSNTQGTEAIFGSAAGIIKSQALLRIDETLDIPPSILAFGSRDPDMFVEGQGAELITFLCRCVERALKFWNG
jgi:uncharacterized protein YigA (DUF484 family)